MVIEHQAGAVCTIDGQGIRIVCNKLVNPLEHLLVLDRLLHLSDGLLHESNKFLRLRVCGRLTKGGRKVPVQCTPQCIFYYLYRHGNHIYHWHLYETQSRPISARGAYRYNRVYLTSPSIPQIPFH